MSHPYDRFAVGHSGRKRIIRSRIGRLPRRIILSLAAKSLWLTPHPRLQYRFGFFARHC
jgi:hypothetical protein